VELIQKVPVTSRHGVKFGSPEFLQAMVATIGVSILIAAGIGLLRLQAWGYGLALVALLVGTMMFQHEAYYLAFAGLVLGSMNHWFGHSRKLEQAIDRLAESVGIDLHDSVQQQIEQLLHQKRNTEAARLLHETLQINWDEAHTLVAEWPFNAAYRKVLFMVSRLKRDRGN
jgi:hypothetical protein